MEVKPGYKQTEVGVIPRDWDVAIMETLLATPIQNGVFNEPSRKGKGSKLINVIDLYGSFPVNTDDLERFHATQDEILRFGVRHGDIFFTRSSLTPEGIAQCNIFREGENETIVFDCHIIRVRPNCGKAEPFFLARYCMSRPARRFLVTNAKTTTMTTIDQSVIAKLPIALPSLPEQRAIAETLSDVDALLNGLDRLIAKKRDLKQGTMQQLLTGQTRLPNFDGVSSTKHTEVGDIPEDWNLECIENIAHITTGSKNTEEQVEDGQYPFFVRSQKVERINTYSFDGEAVLTAGDGVGTGKVFHYINGKFDVHQRVYRISDFSRDVNGYFFYLYFSTHFHNRIMQMTAKSSVDSVRREMIARMPVPLPPTKVEQTAIAEVLTDMDTEIAALEQRRKKTRGLKQAMMQELLTGKTRLI